MEAREKYISRRKTLLEKMKDEKGVILFIGNTNSPAQGRNNPYQWRQDSSWLYFFGIDQPDFAAIIDIENGQQILFGNEATLDDIIWNGPVPKMMDIAFSTGIDRYRPYADLELFVKGRKVHFLPASRLHNAMEIGRLVGIDPLDAFSKGKEGCKAASAPLVHAVISMRIVKDEEEVGYLEEACTLGQQMHRIAREGIHIGTLEQEVVGRMEGYAKSTGWGLSFQTIFTQHGEVFHNASHSTPIRPGRLLVVDAGIESNDHYASDFTRTYPTSGRFTPQQRDIYDIVVECNELAFSMTKPGIEYRDVHIAVVTRMLERLRDLRLVLGDPAEMCADGIGGLFMPHGLGHNIGLDDHDMEDYGEDLIGYAPGQRRSSQLGLGSLRMARPLQEGNVISDEPGIYFIPALIRNWCQDKTDKGCVRYDRLEKYLEFGGIRLEDDVLVTAEGARRLGKNRLEIKADDIEEIMSD